MDTLHSTVLINTQSQIVQSVMLNRDQNPVGISDVDNDISAMLIDGGESSRKILCEDCLPKGHRWAFE